MLDSFSDKSPVAPLLANKVCSQCHVEKSINEFFPRKNSKCGYYSECKKCKRQRGLELHYRRKSGNEIDKRLTAGGASRFRIKGVAKPTQLQENETEHEFIKRVYFYDPLTGIFIRRIKTSHSSYIDKPLGTKNLKGHLTTSFLGKQIFIHRLAWFYQTGKWPSEHIDHINGITNDNRWCNLREASNAENLWNRGKQKNNTTGAKGVYFDKERNLFAAELKVNGKRIRLGRFKTIEEAESAHIAASRKLHGEFMREGVS
jgi:hypothetical protein